jgi:hypothetical protein
MGEVTRPVEEVRNLSGAERTQFRDWHLPFEEGRRDGRIQADIEVDLLDHTAAEAKGEMA